MTICQFCGTKLMDGAKFCYRCERELEYPEETNNTSGGVHDSVVVRSPGAGSVYAPSVTVGKDTKYCNNCETPITDRNRSIRCSDCGKLFCASCELDFRAERRPGEKPYCCECFEKHQELLRQEQERREAAELKAVKEFVNSIGMRMKLIPAGEFMMGSKNWDYAKPIHKVKLTKPFYSGVYPVTQKEWAAVMGSNPSYFKGENLPVEKVSWHDCQEFIEKLNSKEGTYKYRLPTEAEWEYACRAGSTTEYCYGDDEGRLGEYAWYDGNSNDKTHPVGTKRPNKWGLHDMHGNVWEWCEDWCDDYTEEDAVDAHGPTVGSGRIRRSGGWSSVAGHCTSGYRHFRDPANRDSYLGVRLVRSV